MQTATALHKARNHFARYGAIDDDKEWTDDGNSYRETRYKLDGTTAEVMMCNGEVVKFLCWKG